MDFFRWVTHGLRKTISQLFIEIPARWAGMDKMIERLDKSGQKIEKRLNAARDRETNRETLAHITGIEQWGQRRLKIALGELPIHDEYDSYQPIATDWTELRANFRTVRQETLALSKALRMAGIDPRTHILHNQLGNLTLLGWLYYLHLHANLESTRIS